MAQVNLSNEVRDTLKEIRDRDGHKSIDSVVRVLLAEADEQV